MSNAGRAVFEAVGNFGSLRREAGSTETALRKVKDEAKGIGTAIPRDGGDSVKGLQAIANKAGEIGDKMTRTGQNLSLKLTAPLTLAGGLAVRSFANFEKSIVSAGAKSDATKKQIKAMKDMALDLGAKTMFSAGDAAGAFDLLAAAGFNAKDAMKALPGVMKGAQATGEDLGLTADTIAKAMNVWNVKPKDATKVSDLFAQAANTTALGMEDIAYGIANAGEVGPRFGQGMEGVIGTLGRLVDLGVPAASAGVAIRSALTNLAAPATKASTLINDLGIKTRDATTGELLQLPDLIENVSTALDKGSPGFKKYSALIGMNADQAKEWAKKNGVSAAQVLDIQTAMKKGGPAFKDYTMKTLFGVEGAKAFSLAMSDGKPVILDTQKDVKKMAQLQDGLAETMGKKHARAWIKARTENGKFVASGKDTVRALDAMNRSSEGTADKFVKVFGETTAAHIDSFMGSLESLGISIVETVAPALDDLAEKAVKFLGKIQKFTKEHDWAGPLIVGAGLFLAALGPVLIVVGSLLKMIRGVSRAGGAVGRVMRKVTGRSRTTTPTTGGGGDVGGPQSVYWAKPMPVYLTGKPVGASPSAKPVGPSKTTTAGSQAPWRGWGLSEKPARSARTPLRTRAASVARGGAKIGAGAAGAGLAAGAMTLATGGSAGDAAKMMGIFAGVEVAIVLLQKLVTGKFGQMIGKAAWWSAQMVGKTLLWTGKTLASVAWWGLKMVAKIAWTAAKFVAQYAWMAAKALFNAARIAASWLIAMGPIGWIIAGIGLLVAAFVWAYKNVKWFRDGVDAAVDAIGAAWRWLWNSVLQPVFKGLVEGIAWILDKYGDMLDAMSHVPGFGWAKAAADKMHGAADKARELADGIKKIPPRKDIVISVTTIYSKKGQGGQDALANIQSHVEGKLQGQRTGGLISGRGRGDRHLRLLEDGEFTVKRTAVRRPGVLAALRALNRAGSGASPEMLAGHLLAGRAMAAGVAGRGAAPVASGDSTLQSDRAAGRGRGNLTVIVNNPTPEPAGQSVGSVLRRRTFEEGWASA